MEYIKQYEILIKKAKDDYNTAKIVFENIKDINIDIALFHLQQAVEKSLKAVLIYNKIEFPKTHKLDILIDILAENKINIEIDDDLIILNDYAVEARYDYIGETFDNIVETTEKVDKLIKKVENMIK